MLDQAAVVSNDVPPKERRRLSPSHETLVSIAFFVALWFFWGVRYGDYLFAAQDNSFFLFRNDFFARWLETPEGLLCYLTTFLIQFFYYPLVGGAILSGLGVAVQVALARLLKLRGAWSVASFLPTCFLTISATWPGYFVYIPFNLPLMFSGFLGVLFALAGLALYRTYSNSKFVIRLLFAYLFIRLGYLGFGFWAPFAGLLFAVDELTRFDRADASTRRSRARLALAILALVVLCPIVDWRCYYYARVKSCNIFLQGLIEEVRYEKDSLTAFFTYGAAILAPIATFVLFAVARLAGRNAAQKADSRAKKREERDRRRQAKRQAAREERLLATGRAAAQEKVESSEERARRLEREERAQRVKSIWELAFIVVVFTFFASYHTRSFFNCLATCRALDDADWERILEIDASDPHPISHMVGMRVLALYKTGRLAESAFERPIGGESTLPVTVEDNARALAGNPYYKAKMKLFSWRRKTEGAAYRAKCELAYCHWGLTNVAARIATDNFVATEDRSNSFLKTLATAAVVNGEDDLARRYLNELAQTLFYRNWANLRLAFLDSSAFLEDVRDFNSDADYGKGVAERRAAACPKLSLDDAATRHGVEQDELRDVAKQIADARALRPIENRVSKTAYPNFSFLLDVVRFDDFDKVPVEQQELILIAALLQKKGDVFMSRVEDYLRSRSGSAPKGIEQGYATWRYSQYGAKWQDCDYKFSPETIEQLTDFITYTSNVNVSSVAIQATLREYCAGLYWGYATDDSVFKQY